MRQMFSRVSIFDIQSLRDWISRFFSQPSLRTAAIVFLFSRTLLSVWMWFIRKIFSQTFPPHPILRPYFGIPATTNGWLEPWQRWDTLHYQAIAAKGYSAFDSALFTPPLYPWLMRGVGGLLGGNTLIAGILISNIAYFCGLIILYLIASQQIPGQNAAERTIVYLASFPTAFFLLAAYTESLFLLSALLAIYFIQREKYWWSGVWGAFGSLTRLPGVLIAVPLAYWAWENRHRANSRKAWLPFFLTCGGALIFPLYVWLVLKLPPWEPWFVQTQRFAGGFTIPGVNLYYALQRILSGEFYYSDLLDFILMILFIACTPLVWKRLSKVYSVYYFSFLMLYLARTSQIQPLLSSSRYVLILFPAFIVLGLMGKNHWIHRVLLTIFWIGLLLSSGQFAIWGWVG